jgi:hypothetical protein
MTLDDDLTFTNGTTCGVVVGIEDEFARILVGEEHEPWDFPMSLMPDGVESGTAVHLGLLDGRPVRVRIDAETEMISSRGVDHRLARLERRERRSGVEAQLDA